MEPILTIAVPCYNTEGFLARCLDPLMSIGDGIEVITVNDGSTDGTSSILHAYERRYPSILKVIDQANGGWGEVINRAIAEATGTFFIELDSDDHLDGEVLRKVMHLLQDFESGLEDIDLLVTNYVYDRVTDSSTHTISYRNFMQAGRVLTWDDLRKPKIDEYWMIHAMCYRTSLLRESGISLPGHISYMDSLLALHPLPLVRRFYYLDVDLYYYQIGRVGQSIDVEVLKGNIGQQLTATKIVIDDFDYEELSRRSVKLADSIARYLSSMMTVSMVYLFKVGTDEAHAQADEIWHYLKAKDPAMYHKVVYSIAGLAWRRTTVGRVAVKGAYAFARKLFKFA